jgi:hypothetical protein
MLLRAPNQTSDAGSDSDAARDRSQMIRNNDLRRRQPQALSLAEREGIRTPDTVTRVPH